MLESMIDIPQFEIYNTSIAPLVRYVEEQNSSIYDENHINKIIPYAKQSDFILSTFLDIVDDLNYDKEKFEEIIYNLDDDYDSLSQFVKKLNPKFKSHKKLLDISQNILTNLMKVQNELGLIISQNEHQKI
jgi:hypothetical protein